MNFLDMNCVSVTQKAMNGVPHEERDTVKPIIALEDLIRKLMVVQPTWRYEFTHKNYNRQLDEFDIYQGDEKLGCVEWSYRHDGMTYAISNHRIANQMARGNYYRTKDINKAVLRIKKVFSKKTTEEIVQSAWDSARQIMSNNALDKSHPYNESRRHVERRAMEYVMGEGFAAFLTHMANISDKSKMNEFNARLESMHKLGSEYDVINKIRDCVPRGKGALVIRDGGEYVFQLGGEIQRYTDATFPEDLRGKLGMLKLVEKEHYIDEVGTKINDTTYVVYIGEKDERVQE